LEQPAKVVIRFQEYQDARSSSTFRFLLSGLVHLPERQRVAAMSLPRFLYATGIKQIEEAYAVSASVMEERVAERLAKVEAIDPKDIKFEAGALDPRFIDVYLYEQDDIALQVIRQSFAIALYHHWERSVMRWMGLKNYEYEQAYAWLEDQGMPVDDGIEDLRILMRVVKHEKANEELLKRRADLYNAKLPDFVPRLLPAYQGQFLHITDDAMTRFFKSLRNSGVTAEAFERVPRT
jgi:hypothetical protein